MKQRTNWMRFLLIGISLISIGLMQSCEKGEVDYVVNLDYFYVNKTVVPITIKTFSLVQNEANLLEEYHILPNDTLLINVNATGPKDLKIKGIKRPALFSDSTLIIYNQAKCLVFWPINQGVNDINNYEVKEFKNNSFDLTYIFTKEQYQNTESCP